MTPEHDKLQETLELAAESLDGLPELAAATRHTLIHLIDALVEAHRRIIALELAKERKQVDERCICGHLKERHTRGHDSEACLLCSCTHWRL